MEIKETQKKKHWQAYESEYNQSGLIEVVFFLSVSCIFRSNRLTFSRLKIDNRSIVMTSARVVFDAETQRRMVTDL